MSCGLLMSCQDVSNVTSCKFIIHRKVCTSWYTKYFFDSFFFQGSHQSLSSCHCFHFINQINLHNFNVLRFSVYYSTRSTSTKLSRMSLIFALIEFHKLISLIPNKDSQKNNRNFVRQKFSEDLN